MKSRVITKYILFASLVIVLMTSKPNAAPTPVWSLLMEEEITWFEMTIVGDLVVATKDTLYGISSANGKESWRLSKTGEKLYSFDWEIVSGTPYAIVNLKKKVRGASPLSIMIDVRTGAELWTTEKLGLGESYGHFLFPQNDVLIIYGKMAKKPKDKVVIAVKTETGELVWIQRDFFGQKDPPLLLIGDNEHSKKSIFGHQRPLFDSDSTMIIFMTKNGLQKFDLRTGNLIWKSAVKTGEPPITRYGYARMLLDEGEGVVYTAYDKKLCAFSTKDGNSLWRDELKFKGIVRQMTLLKGRLIVLRGKNREGKGKQEISAHNPTTGQVIWDMPFKKLKNASRFRLHNDHIVLAGNKKLYLINSLNGEYSTLANDIEFRGKESPNWLELRNGSYLLMSSQNVMLIDGDGNTKYHSYNKAPGTGFFSTLGDLFTLKITSSMIGVGFRATSITRDNIYMSADIKNSEGKGRGLVKINKDSGETEKSIIFGTKTPKFRINYAKDLLYFQSGKKTISCYEF